MSGDRDEKIRQRAHKIWEQEGRPEGQGYRHWAQAESEVDAAAKAVKKPAAKKAAAPKAVSKAAPAAKTVAPAKKPAAKKKSTPKIGSAK